MLTAFPEDINSVSSTLSGCSQWFVTLALMTSWGLHRCPCVTYIHIYMKNNDKYIFKIVKNPKTPERLFWAKRETKKAKTTDKYE